MENVRFTLFNGITLLVMALTAAMAVARIRKGPVWPAAYYLAIAGYAIAFPHSLNLYMVLAGIVCALLLRYGVLGRVPLLGEFGVLAYVLGRSAALVMMW